MWIVHADIDVSPGVQPRPYEYNEKGMAFEGFELKGGPIFGACLFEKEVETKEEAEKLVKEVKEKINKLYVEGHIRGGRCGIEEKKKDAVVLRRKLV